MLLTQNKDSKKITSLKGGLYQNLIQKNAAIAIVGLTRTGLNLAQKFSQDFEVIVFDKNRDRVQLASQGINPFGLGEFNCNFHITSKEEDIAHARLYIVATSIAVNEYYKPNLKSLSDSALCISKALKKRDFVIFETTSYPGCIEEMCLPILEKFSGLKVNKDFKLGFSPERFDYRTGEDCGEYKKLVSAMDESALRQISRLYSHIYSSGVHKVPNIRLTEILRIIDRTKSRISGRSSSFAF